MFIINLLFFTRKYDDWACEILTRCHRDRKSSTQSRALLTRVLQNWGNVTCLYLAEVTKNHKFLTHPVVKSLIDDKWENGIIGRGKMQSRWRAWNTLFEPLKVLISIRP